MLKITLTETAKEEKWILCGRLAEPWISELWSTWRKAREEHPGRSCVVDLDDVTFIDESAERVLLTMMSENVRFVARGVCTKQLLKDLRSENKRRLRKCMEYPSHGE